VRRLLVVTLIAGCSPSADLGSSSAAIIGGTPDDGDPAVVGLVVRSLRCTKDRPPPTCTGTLIAPRVVLTAAHCLDNRRPSDLRVLVGSSRDTGTLLDVDEARVHPSWDPSTQRFDIALLRLTAPALVAPTSVATLEPSTFVGTDVRLVGFGLDESATSGRKRSGTAHVSSIDSEVFRYVPGPSMSCGGDSGGPVFVDGGLVGVTRSGDAACAESGTAVRLDPVWSSFVAPYVESVASAGSRPLFERGVDECSASCASNEDCPAAMLCLADRAGGHRCGLPALMTGRFGDDCTDDSACGGGTCVEIDDRCRCFEECTRAPAETASGGCAFGSATSSGLFVLGVLAGALGMARFRKRTFGI
jgi:secreted trypsin-like serine protease